MEQLINFDDYENMSYPNLDIKRAVIDKMLTDELNEDRVRIGILEQKKASYASIFAIFAGLILIAGSLIFPWPLMMGVASTGVFFVVIGGVKAILE